MVIAMFLEPESCLPSTWFGTSSVFQDGTSIGSLLPFVFGVNAAASSARLSCVYVLKMFYELCS